jgi:imidazolonepropionase-like amidohydrolase
MNSLLNNQYFLKSLFASVFIFLAGCSDQSSIATVEENEAAEAAVDESTILITNGMVIDGTGNVIKGGSVLIEDGRIAAVGTDVTAPADARTINAMGKAVMPGFIEGHRHIIQGNPDEWMANTAAANMQEFLDAGFTTVLSAIDAPQILELRRMINDGEMIGPRILSGTFVPINILPPGEPTTDPARTDVSRPPYRPTDPAGKIPDQVIIDAVQAAADAGFDYTKTVVTVTPNGPEVDSLTLMVEETHKHGLKAIVHAVGKWDVLEVIKAKPDHLVHTPHIGQLTLEEAQTIADAGIPMVSSLGTLGVFFDENNQPIFRDGHPYGWQTLSSSGQGPVNARLLWNAGITYGFGTDTSFHPTETFKHELKALQLVFSEQDIIEIMTEHTAKAVFLEDEIGSLEAGKAADVVIVDGNPLENSFDMLNVDLVIKGGDIVVNKM